MILVDDEYGDGVEIVLGIIAVDRLGVENVNANGLDASTIFGFGVVDVMKLFRITATVC